MYLNEHLLYLLSLFWLYFIKCLKHNITKFAFYSRDKTRLSGILKSKKEENEAYLSEIEVSFLLAYMKEVSFVLS